MGAVGVVVVLSMGVAPLAPSAQEVGREVVLEEDFEDEILHYAQQPAAHSAGSVQFSRTSGTGLDLGYTVTPIDGAWWFVAEDTYLDLSHQAVEMTYSDVDVSAHSDIELSVLLAQSAHGYRYWSPSDFVHFDASWDGGTTWVPVLWFEADGYNQFGRVDADFDGTPDGAALTRSFDTFTAPILGEGTTLDLRVQFFLVEDGRDIAMDLVRITGIGPAEDEDDDEQDDGGDEETPDGAGQGEEPPLYRARNGDPGRGEEPDHVYVERDVELADQRGIVDDHDPDQDGWAIVGIGQGGKERGKVADFLIDEHDRPYVAVLHEKDGCVVLTPRSLDAVDDLDPRHLDRTETAPLDCRAEPAGADLDGDGQPDDTQTLYEVLDLGDRLMVRRSTAAAAAQLGVFDVDDDGDGWVDYAEAKGKDHGALKTLDVIEGQPILTIISERDGCLVLAPKHTDPISHGDKAHKLERVFSC